MRGEALKQSSMLCVISPESMVSHDHPLRAVKGWTWLEGWVEFLDGAVRYRQSRQLVSDLQHFRVSHNKMAVEMREIYARAKGGWLGKMVAERIKLPGRKQKGRAGAGAQAR